MSRLNVGSFRHPDGTDDNISLTSTGRVGIGTTTPATPLDVTGSVFAPATFGRNGGTTNTTGSGVIAFSNLGTPGGSSNADMILRSDYAWAAQINNASSATNALIVDTSNNFKFNSGYGSVATAFGVRAWIDFDGTAATIGTGNGSGNMDAVTDNGTGDYTVNFTTDMPDNDYCPIITGTTIGNGRLSSGMIKESTTLAVGGFTVTFKQKNSVSSVGWDFYDPVDVCIAVVR